MKIIALFFPAFISISIYAKRRSIELAPNLSLLIRYGIYVMAVNWCDMSLTTYVFGIDNSILEYMEKWPFFTKYVLIAIFFAWIIPYIEEVVGKFIHINFRIEPKSEEGDESGDNNQEG